jgi:hypothetical protein
VTYSNQRITKETEYYGGLPRSYIFYTYDKYARLAIKDFSKSKNNRNHTTRVTYQYDDNGRLVLRKYDNIKGGFDKFIYEGDSIILKLMFNDHSVLKGVGKKVTRNKSELIIFYKVDTTRDVDFLQRIKPIREYQSSWDDNRTFTQWGEFEYDSVGSKITLSIKKSEFKMNRLVKTTSFYNTASLKGEFVTEYFYNDRGLLELETSKHDGYTNEKRYEYDEHGNRITQGGLVYRFLYDTNGNWVTKQRFHKKGSSSTDIIGGVIKTRKYNEDSWINEEQREITYFE